MESNQLWNSEKKENLPKKLNNFEFKMHEQLFEKGNHVTIVGKRTTVTLINVNYRAFECRLKNNKKIQQRNMLMGDSK